MFFHKLKNWKFVGYSILISCSEGLGRDQGSMEGLLAISAPRGELRGRSPLGQRGPSCCALRHLQLTLRRSSLCCVPAMVRTEQAGSTFLTFIRMEWWKRWGSDVNEIFPFGRKKTTTSQTHTVMQPSHRQRHTGYEKTFSGAKRRSWRPPPDSRHPHVPGPWL